MNKQNLVHIGKIHPFQQRPRYVFLRQRSSIEYAWYEGVNDQEILTDIAASSVEEAIRLAHRIWRPQSFCTVNCGFNYSLPERDEHGINALFYQMVASYSSTTGIYFERERGHNCVVHYASHEALSLWKKLKANNRL